MDPVSALVRSHYESRPRILRAAAQYIIQTCFKHPTHITAELPGSLDILPQPEAYRGGNQGAPLTRIIHQYSRNLSAEIKQCNEKKKHHVIGYDYVIHFVRHIPVIDLFA